MWLAAFAGIVTDSAQKEIGWAARSDNLVPARMTRSTAGAAGICAAAATVKAVTPTSAVTMTKRTVNSSDSQRLEIRGTPLKARRSAAWHRSAGLGNRRRTRKERAGPESQPP